MYGVRLNVVLSVAVPASVVSCCCSGIMECIVHPAFKYFMPHLEAKLIKSCQRACGPAVSPFAASV